MEAFGAQRMPGWRSSVSSTARTSASAAAWYTSTVPKRTLYGTVMRSRERKNKDKKGKRRRAPIAVNGTVPPRRMRNETRRPREYLTVKEVELLMESARTRGRYGHRDATMILIAFRHGLRPAEVCALRWDMIDPCLSGCNPQPLALVPDRQRSISGKDCSMCAA